jgi:ribosomal protein L37AE/L43A
MYATLGMSDITAFCPCPRSKRGWRIRGWRIRPDAFCRDVCDPRYVRHHSILSMPKIEARVAHTSRRFLSGCMRPSVCRHHHSILSMPKIEASFAGGAYVPTLFVGMYATLGMPTPSQHFVHAQDRSVIPEIEPPTRPRPAARMLDQASSHGIVVHVIQFLIPLLWAPDVHVPVAHTSRQKPSGRMRHPRRTSVHNS